MLRAAARSFCKFVRYTTLNILSTHSICQRIIQSLLVQSCLHIQSHIRTYILKKKKKSLLLALI